MEKVLSICRKDVLMNKVVKLISGGIDSTIMSNMYEGLNVYVDFGQNYVKEELQALKELGIKYDLVKVNSVFKEDDIYINDRNLVLASLVAMIYNPDIIMIAGTKDDNCVDKTKEAFENISDTISRYSNKEIKVISPFWDKTKSEIVEQYADKKELKKTFSCYNPINGKPCMNCPACLRKTIALVTNGVEVKEKLSKSILKKYLKKIHTYDKDRISRFFFYLQQYEQINAIDIDGVLCISKGHDFENSVPIYENIEKVNKYDGINVLYTSRLESDREVTEKWLKKHNVKYDCLITNKLPYTSLVDDRAKLTL